MSRRHLSIVIAATRPFWPILSILTWIVFVIVAEKRVGWLAGFSGSGQIVTDAPVIDFMVLDACSLVVLFAWFSNAKWSARVFVAGGLLAAIVFGVAVFGDWPTYWRELDQAAMQILVLFVTLVVLRLVGIHLGLDWPNQPSHTKDVARMRWTTLDLVLTVATVALLLGAVRNLKPIALWQHGPSFYLRYRTIMTLAFGLIVLAAAWTALGNRNLLVRLVVLAATIVASVLANALAWCWATGHYWDQWNQVLQDSSKFVGVYALLVTGSLAAFRLHGYRLRR